MISTDINTTLNALFGKNDLKSADYMRILLLILKTKMGRNNTGADFPI